MIRPLDHDYVSDLLARLNRLHPDTKPAWGSMTPPEMIGHLIATVRYTMGKSKELPFVGNWFTRRVMGPLVMYGIVRLPRNLKVPARPGAPERPTPTGDIETLHAAIEEYLALVQSGELRAPVHPLFGEVGIDGWARLHVVHFEHHLRQFGL